jgi:predicted ATPase
LSTDTNKVRLTAPTPSQLDVFNPREAMTDLTITELDERIAMIRQNINELIEQAAAYSGAEDENKAADRIAQQEQELSRLIELRDALLGR